MLKTFAPVYQDSRLAGWRVLYQVGKKLTLPPGCHAERRKEFCIINML
jgi:hypothetical protein